MTMFWITVVITILVVYAIWQSNKYEKWRMMYFFIIRSLNDGVDEIDIALGLVNNYGISRDLVEEAIQAAKDGNEDWFLQNVK